MIKRMAVMLVLVGVVFGGIFGFQAFKSKMIRKYMSAAQPPQTVSTTKAVFEQWQTAERSVGTLVAVRGADLAPEVAGIVQSIQFKSGEQVKAGAPLVQLNADADVASLKALEASAALAEITYRRDLAQFKVKAVSQATLDADAAAVKSSTAQAEAQQALVAKKLIRAPFAGRAGIRAVDLGQYLSAGTKIVTLQALDPVFVDFLVPQAALAHYALGQKVVVETDSFPRQEIRGPRVGVRRQGRPGDAQHQSARRGAQPETAAAAGHVRDGRDRAGSARSACSRCRRPRFPSTPMAIPCSSSRKARAPAARRRSWRSRSSSPPARRAATRLPCLRA